MAIFKIISEAGKLVGTISVGESWVGSVIGSFLLLFIVSLIISPIIVFFNGAEFLFSKKATIVRNHTGTVMIISFDIDEDDIGRPIKFTDKIIVRSETPPKIVFNGSVRQSLSYTNHLYYHNVIDALDYGNYSNGNKNYARGKDGRYAAFMADGSRLLFENEGPHVITVYGKNVKLAGEIHYKLLDKTTKFFGAGSYYDSTGKYVKTVPLF